MQFDGLRGVGAEALADSWSDLANRDVPIAALCTIRDRAATALREAVPEFVPAEDRAKPATVVVFPGRRARPH